MKRIHAGLRKFSGINLPDREVYTIKSLFSFLPKNKRAKISTVYRDDLQAKLEKNKYLLVPIWECVVRDAKGKIIGHYQHPSQEALEEERAAKQAPIDEVVRQTPIKIDWTKCQPFTIPTDVQNGTEDIAEHFAVNLKASDRRMRSTKEPTFTQTTANHQYLCETIVANFSHTQNNHDSMCKSDDDPLPTICGKGMLGMIQSLNTCSGKKSRDWFI